MKSLQQQIQSEWVDRLKVFDKIYLGLSGGLDSMVLLSLICRIPILHQKLSIIHVHHNLSHKADDWAIFCKEQAARFGVAFNLHQVEVSTQSNIEENARNARYSVFKSYINTPKDALILAHHQNDQAETVLLNLFRGAGIDGLSGMREQKFFGLGVLYRPLLNHTREELHQYALVNDICWIEDDSNQDTRFSRNFVRHELIPLIQSRWPSSLQNMARTSTLCQMASEEIAELTNLSDKLDTQHPELLPLSAINALSDYQKNQLLRKWFDINGLKMPDKKHIEVLKKEVIDARQDATPSFKIGDICIRRHQEKLYLSLQKEIKTDIEINWHQFPVKIQLEHIGTLRAKRSSRGFGWEEGMVLRVRFRQGGENFKWRGKTRPLKKWMQDWSIPTWLRGQVPLIFVDDKLAVVCGYAISDLFFDEHAGYQFILDRYVG